MLRRREFIQTGIATAGAFAFGPAFWQDKFAAAAPAKVGRGPYGPLGPADLNGIRLPEGFSSREIARANAPVGSTGFVYPLFPDGQATYALPDGGFILVTNSEVPTDGGGGASAIRFSKTGAIEDAYRILGGTRGNCSGGATPWGTWLSAEEYTGGRVWECDPFGQKPAVVHPALGVFNHEAVAVDPDGERLYLTEDRGDGAFYRFTPANYPSLKSGRLEAAIVAANGRVTWKRVPDPLATTKETRQQVPGYTKFRRGEGIWFDSGIVYVATSSDGRVHAYNTTLETIELIYDEQSHKEPPLTDVDNVTVSALSGDVFVCEDAGTLDIGIITPEGQVSKFLQLTGAQHGDPNTDASSETTGPVFDPSGTRFFFSSQRGFGTGVVYEITGPFRLERPRIPSPPGLRVDAASSRAIGRFRRSGLPVSVLVDEPAKVRVKLTTYLPRRGRANASRKRLTLVKKTSSLSRRGGVDLRLRPSRKMRKRLRKRKKVTARLTVRAVDALGNVSTHTQLVQMRSGGRRPKKP